MPLIDIPLRISMVMKTILPDPTQSFIFLTSTLSPHPLKESPLLFSLNNHQLTPNPCSLQNIKFKFSHL